MQQLCIEYFYPLTEQVALDLDFTPCEKYIEEWRAKQFATSVTSGSYLISGVNGAAWATVSLKDVEPSFTIDVDQTPITITSIVKPNIFRRYIYKILGMKWKAK